MEFTITSSPDFVIRSLTTAAEIEAFYWLNAQVFRPNYDTLLIATRRRQFITQAPDFHPEQIRGAFLGTTFLGGYRIPVFTVHLGPARLRIGGIGAVVTHPAYRHQGIAAALMRDAITYATQRRYALLLLDGIANFYAQFGYVNILDDLTHAVALEEVHTHAPSPYIVRPATLDDASELLALHQRHYGAYPGFFDRTLEWQEHLLRHRLIFAEEPPVMVLTPDDEPCGYFFPFQGRTQAYSVLEVAAEDWPATLALLQYHARLVEHTPDAPKELVWPLPPDSPTLYFLADNLAVRSETHRVLNVGWMACPAHVPALLHALIPLWQERMQRHALAWSGLLALGVDNTTCYLEARSGSLRMSASPSIPVEAVRLTSHVFLQLLFGYRPLIWAVHQPAQWIPDSLLPLLAILFPQEPAWIAGSNSF
jgi:GNAT superfamily N-acetyltransferase